MYRLSAELQREVMPARSICGFGGYRCSGMVPQCKHCEDLLSQRIQVTCSRSHTVSTSGGTATNIYTSSGSDIIGGTITWSNNGSELAFAYKSGSTVSIKVINGSTGARKIPTLFRGNYLNISSVKWSHSGSNTLAFSATTVAGNAVSDYYLYTIAPTSGSTETQCVNGFNGEWSPNNATLVYTDGFNNTKKVTISSGTVTTIGSYVPIREIGNKDEIRIISYL